MDSRLHQGFSFGLLSRLKKRPVQILIRTTIPLFLIGCSAPKLVVESGIYNFAETEIGATVTKDIAIENKGKGNLKISNIDLSGEKYSQKKQAGEIVVFPNQKYLLNVKFSPNEPGNYSGIVSIHSNDPSNKVLNVQLQGKGVEPKLPEIRVLTTTLDFLKTHKDSARMKTVTLSNTGKADLLINDLVTNGDEFYIDKTNQNKLIILPGQSVNLNIEFRPVRPGHYSGVLTIYSNDPKNKISSVSLKGEGYEPVKKTPTKADGKKVNSQLSTKTNDTEDKTTANEPPVTTTENKLPVITNAKSVKLGPFTHDGVKGTMKIQEGSMKKSSEMAFTFEVQKTGDFEILVTPGYELVSNDFQFTGISSFTDGSRYKRFVKERVQPNSKFQVAVKRKENSPDNFKFIFKLFPL